MCRLSGARLRVVLSVEHQLHVWVDRIFLVTHLKLFRVGLHLTEESLCAFSTIMMCVHGA